MLKSEGDSCGKMGPLRFVETNGLPEAKQWPNLEHFPPSRRGLPRMEMLSFQVPAASHVLAGPPSPGLPVISSHGLPFPNRERSAHDMLGVQVGD